MQTEFKGALDLLLSSVRAIRLAILPLVIEISFFSIGLFHFVDCPIFLCFYVNKKVMKSVFELIFE